MDPAEEIPTSFLKADEVDEAGPVGLDLSQSQQFSEESARPPLDTIEEREALGDGSDLSIRRNVRGGVTRPPMQRDRWAPAPQQPPPPAPPRPAEDIDNSTDSLSLMELRRLVADMPKSEPQSYAFTYTDCSSFEEELEELFDYTEDELGALSRTELSCMLKWEEFCLTSDPHLESLNSRDSHWPLLSNRTKESFLKFLRSDLDRDDNEKERTVSVEALLYICLGCWTETVNIQSSESVKKEPMPYQEEQEERAEKSKYKDSEEHIQALKDNLLLVGRIVGVKAIFEVMQAASRREAASKNNEEDEPQENPPFRQIFATFPTIYLLVDFFRRRSAEQEDSDVLAEISSVVPSLLNFLNGLMAELRWEESDTYPQLKIFPLYWKSLLFAFGGLEEYGKIKSALSEDLSESRSADLGPRITASPLDYHLFRQEIISKYPAFDPPPPLFPFESNSASMAPLLQEEERHTASDLANTNSQNSSIFYQPVHISTPAPSPPPSPAGPSGKGVKKQNYQTNQLFPFVYPPLDSTSNDLGGKGSTALQDALVGRKWQGSDIPASILEAAEIFSERMRATRAMKQLWAERVRFMKYERGFENSEDGREANAASDSNGENHRSSPMASARPAKWASKTDETDTAEKLDDDSKRRLEAVDAFYENALPKLQSIVIVLLKVLLQTVTTLITQPNAHNGAQNGPSSQDQNNQTKPEQSHPANQNQDDQSDSYLLNLDTVRSQEILGKSVSGILLLLLKWFKLSHILKFEYLTQLLLDSNYIQLILKLFTHQELERVVNYKCEKENWNFFAWSREKVCSDAARYAAIMNATENPNSSPPAQNQQQQPPQNSETDPQPASPAAAPSVPTARPPPPEVDELGYPISDVPPSTITDYSWRNIFTSINHLRLLQKVAKGKTHRQILMMQYKYSNVVKKCLKVPQPDIRLYTLKIIKGQVPYCHRKWRQNNMRIITAIYLHCRPELRDDWLAGLDLDHEMSEALPAEQALRGLTYWYNVRNYPSAMGKKAGDGKGRDEKTDVDGKSIEEGPDFFARELEIMERLALQRVNGDLVDEDGAGAGGEEIVVESAQRDGPVQMEAW